MNEAVVYRLSLVRELLRQGNEAAQNPLPIDRMRALLSLDHAVELALTTLLPVLLPIAGETPRREVNFQELVAKLLRLKPSLGSYREALGRIRRLRNQVQHDGIIPSPEDARTAAVEVESFLRATVQEVLGRGIEELTLLELIEDASVKEHLTRSEKMLRDGDYAGACLEAALGFHVGTSNAIQNLSSGPRDALGRTVAAELFRVVGDAALAAAGVLGRGGGNARLLFDFADEFSRKLQSEVFSLGNIFELLQRPAFLASLGIPPHDLSRFEETTPRVTPRYGGGFLYAPPAIWPPTKESASFALDFAGRGILRIEAALRVRVSRSDATQGAEGGAG